MAFPKDSEDHGTPTLSGRGQGTCGSRCSSSSRATCTGTPAAPRGNLNRERGAPGSAPAGRGPHSPFPTTPGGRRLPEPPPCVTLSTQARCRPSQPGALESTQLPEQRGSRAEPAAPPPHNPAIVPAAAPRPPAPRHLHPPGAASGSRGPGRGVPGCGGHRRDPPLTTGATPRPHTSWPLFPSPCLGC